MCACDRGLEKVAIMMIDKFGDKCLPGQVNKYRDTSLMWACYKVAIMMIDKLIKIKRQL